MVNTTRGSPSVTAPLNPAIERVKTVLFRPFDLGRWLTIGFCAWLASLGEGGGGGGGGNWHVDPNRGHDLSHELHQGGEFVVENLYWLLPAAAAVILLIAGIWLLVTWLSSRGHFLFLHCVATNRAEVQVPWTLYRKHGNSLFRFRVVLGLASLLLVLPAIAGGIAMVITMIARESVTAPLVLGAIGAFLAAAVFGLAFGIVSKLTLDFAVPIQALRSCTCRAAWRELWTLLSSHKAVLLLYLGFQVLLAIVVGLAIIAIVIATCCCAGCLLAIPFLGTVLLLPIRVFDRAYSLAFLAEFGDSYRLIAD